jgi:capsular polysaccharide biosynthesis protein
VRSDYIKPSITQALAARLIAAVEAERPIQICECRRIYISRQKANSRRVLNEDAVMELLGRYGFQKVVLEDLSLTEAAQMYRNATHIIGVHGSGLTNLIFTANAYVLELFSTGHGIRPEYFQLASIRQCSYYHYVCRSENPSGDVIVDPSILESFVSMAT